MISIRKTTAMVLACSMLVSTAAQANIVRDVADNLTLSNVVLAATTAAALRFWLREPDNKPAAYNWEELFVGVEVKKNLVGLIDDGLIGHGSKKPYLKSVESEGGKIEIVSTTKIDPKGLGGWIQAHYKNVLSALGTVAFLKLVYDAAAETRSGGSFAEALINKLEAYARKLKIHKLSDLGTPVAAGAIGFALGR